MEGRVNPDRNKIHGEKKLAWGNLRNRQGINLNDPQEAQQPSVNVLYVSQMESEELRQGAIL